jgi:hypothetical protein
MIRVRDNPAQRKISDSLDKSEVVRKECIKGKIDFDDGCQDCEYWMKGEPCPTKEKEVKT